MRVSLHLGVHFQSGRTRKTGDADKRCRKCPTLKLPAKHSKAVMKPVDLIFPQSGQAFQNELEDCSYHGLQLKKQSKVGLKVIL